MLSFIIPTHNRHEELAITIERLAAGSAVRACDEVIVLDNASVPAVDLPTRLPNGSRVELIKRGENEAAAARNAGARSASGEWLIMLDDDSSPTSELSGVLDQVPSPIAAVGGDIRLPDGSREAGGLPEVVVGCGCAIRREAFLEVGGYDASFDYYVEEYDLCARLIASGYQIIHTPDIRFEHRKAKHNRDFSRILSRLVRNNAWTIARYAPSDRINRELSQMFARYESIAQREGVSHAFLLARESAEQTLRQQSRTPLSIEQWERFTGVSALREHGIAALVSEGVHRVRLARPGKGAEIVEQELRRVGIEPDPDAQAAIVATLSPGPMLDAHDQAPGPIRLPWSPEHLTRAG